ncbi:hypothetical protein SASPL_138200 [Salvia splendens]|uniref:Uncharacterized protein n=1 Tax=Salvia splendens TaxID=180675 RepID=A0A8X8WUX8_SALSN|nr:hypothetical protein SASPL_138200 [Salvia splendens]
MRERWKSDDPPEFYELLKEYEKELFDFDEEDLGLRAKILLLCLLKLVIGFMNCGLLLKAFRSACCYGDDGGDDPAAKFSTLSSSVFNKIMLFVLNEMDGIIRGILKFPSSGEKKEMLMELMATKQGKKYNLLAALHFWGTGSGALPVVSFLFLRDCCISLSPDCLEDCIKLQHIQFLGNCFTELLRVDIPAASGLELIVTGVARLVPSACYFPLRLCCISKSTLKTQAFQEACVFSIVEELTEHLTQWNYSIAFLELSFIPSVRLSNFSKSTKVDRFRKEIRRLHVSVLIGDRSSKFGSKILSDDDEYGGSEMEDNACALLSDHYSKQQKKVSKKSTTKHTEEMALTEDIVDDLVLSSDEDVPLNDSLEGDDGEPEED